MRGATELTFCAVIGKTGDLLRVSLRDSLIQSFCVRQSLVFTSFWVAMFYWLRILFTVYKERLWKAAKPSVRVASLRAKIWIQDLSNKKLECYSLVRDVRSWLFTFTAIQAVQMTSICRQTKKQSFSNCNGSQFPTLCPWCHEWTDFWCLASNADVCSVCLEAVYPITGTLNLNVKLLHVLRGTDCLVAV
jgi:hypothetical protein